VRVDDLVRGKGDVGGDVVAAELRGGELAEGGGEGRGGHLGGGGGADGGELDAEKGVSAEGGRGWDGG